MQRCSLYCVHKVHARTDGRNHAHTEPQQRYYIPRGDNTKFDQEAHNGLVAIVFTSYFHISPLWPSPLTSDLQNQ